MRERVVDLPRGRVINAVHLEVARDTQHGSSQMTRLGAPVLVALVLAAAAWTMSGKRVEPKAAPTPAAIP